MATETGCNPPNCLQIPKANCFSVVGYSQRPNCGGLIYDFPFDPSLGPSSVGPFSFAPFLCHVFWGFLQLDGSCVRVEVTNPSPTGTPVVGQSNVQCPPGFIYDPIHEACVLEGVLIIWPNGISPPPPSPPPPPPPSPPPINADCAHPNCIIGGLIGEARPGVLSPACLEICGASGKPDDVCDQACCQLCVATDPPVPRGWRDVVSGKLRSRVDFGRAPFELQRPIAPPAIIISPIVGNFRLRNPSVRGHLPLRGG